jgi:hypothetical protein
MSDLRNVCLLAHGGVHIYCVVNTLSWIFMVVAY